MTFDDLCSSFFGRPLRFLYHGRAQSLTSRLANYKRWQQCKTVDNSCRTKQPLSVGCRCEDYLRLPFVDDLRLRGAMQDFLTREFSREARLTRRQTRSSKCQLCHSDKILPFICYLVKLSIACEACGRVILGANSGTHAQRIVVSSPQGMVSGHSTWEWDYQLVDLLVTGNSLSSVLVWKKVVWRNTGEIARK